VPRVPAHRIVALLLLILLAASRIQVGVVKLPFLDRTFLEQHFSTLADRGWEGYVAFLGGVRAQTRAGDTIALIVPARHWDGGYSYAFYRGSYLLAGRQVVPLVQPDDRVVMGNLGAATYLAAWHMPPIAGHPIVWRGHGGVLVKR
jgi:hypothetical protein